VRSRPLPAKDWLFTGIGAAVLALLLLLLPPNPVVSVGLFGAYLVFLVVFLPIAGLSLKGESPRQRSGATAPADTAPANTATNDLDSL
jgi:hypothetical protein